jgi:hypothetical protein
MSQRVATRRRALRRKTKLFVLASLITVSMLIYWEQTALLYLLSTLAICAVLTLIAFADLERGDRELHDSQAAEISEGDPCSDG